MKIIPTDFICPHCEKSGSNFDPTVLTDRNGIHFETCETHKVKWELGQNLFSFWQEIPYTDLEKMEETLESYQPVTPALLYQVEV